VTPALRANHLVYARVLVQQPVDALMACEIPEVLAYYIHCTACLLLDQGMLLTFKSSVQDLGASKAEPLDNMVKTEPFLKCLKSESSDDVILLEEPQKKKKNSNEIIEVIDLTDE
jgi:hypothetical protein